MRCYSTKCGHSVSQHEGDESGMGAPEPCMAQGCICENFVHGPKAMPMEKPPVPTFEAPPNFSKEEE